MNRFNELLDLDLTNRLYLRRLGLQTDVSTGVLRCTVNPDGILGYVVFPSGIEEAAFFLVGMRAVTFHQNEYVSGELKPLGPQSLSEFLRRDGPDMYRELCIDLDSGRLSSLGFSDLIAWSTKRGFLKKLNPKLVEQITACTECLATKKPQRIRSRSAREKLKDAVESLSGYRIDALVIDQDGIKPAEEGKGGKGHDHRRHRPRVRASADAYLEKTPLGRLSDFIVSDLCREACEFEEYSRKTLSRWLKDKKFNRKPGRPTGSITRISRSSPTRRAPSRN